MCGGTGRHLARGHCVGRGDHRARPVVAASWLALTCLAIVVRPTRCRRFSVAHYSNSLFPTHAQSHLGVQHFCRRRWSRSATSKVAWSRVRSRRRSPSSLAACCASQVSQRLRRSAAVRAPGESVIRPDFAAIDCQPWRGIPGRLSQESWALSQQASRACAPEWLRTHTRPVT